MRSSFLPRVAVVVCASMPALMAGDLVGLYFTLKTDRSNLAYRVVLVGPTLAFELNPAGGCAVEVSDCDQAGFYAVPSDCSKGLGEDNLGLVQVLSTPAWRQGLAELAQTLGKQGIHQRLAITVQDLLKLSGPKVDGKGAAPVEHKGHPTPPGGPVDDVLEPPPYSYPVPSALLQGEPVPGGLGHAAPGGPDE